MFISQTLSRCLSAAAVTGSILLAAGPTQAAVIGTFDPVTSIPTLSFRGQIKLEVSPQCYGQGPGSVFNDGPPGCSIDTDFTDIYFYATGDANKTTLQTVHLDSNDSPEVNYANFVGEELVSMDTYDSSIFQVDVDSLGISTYMFLYFVGPFTGTYETEFHTSSESLPQAPGAYLVNCPNYTPDSDGGCFRNPANTNALPGVTTFVNVPEPESVALTAIGLAALVAVRRRRSPAGR